MDIQLALKPLEDLESRLSGFYEWLSTCFADDSGAAGLFYRLSRDEKSHVALIQYERRMLRNGLDNESLTMDPESVFEVQKKIQAVRDAPAPPGLKDAVLLALEIENSAAENHFQLASGRVSGTMSRLLSNLGREDRRHYEALLAFATERGLPVPGKGRTK